MEARWRIELFGGIRVLPASDQATDPSEPKARRLPIQKSALLLAYLALHLRQSHPRDRLLDLFWPDMDADAGRDNLSKALSTLRHQLEPVGVPAGSVLLADRQSVQLDPDAVSTDVADFDELLRAAAHVEGPDTHASLLERAIALYRGELLPGCYGEWVLLEQARCSERYADALEEWAGALEQMGDLESALAAAHRAVEADPYREEPYRAQMRLYATVGRTGAALKVFQELARILKADLGISPAASTRELADRIQQNPDAFLIPRAPRPPREGDRPETGDHRFVAVPEDGVTGPEDGSGFVAPSPRRPVPPSELPLQLTRFFGREREVAHLTRWLRDPETRLVTLTGSGGSGKTRLALEVARQTAPEFAGRVWFVDLAPLRDPSLIPFAVAGALRLPATPGQDPLDGVVEALRESSCLLLLDNFEHLLRDLCPESEGPPRGGSTALVRLLLERVPELTCLVTSRQPLHLGGEHEFPILPLAVPERSAAPERLAAYGSVALYVDRAQSARPDFAVTAQNAEAVAALCRKLEGMPLAIEMAAAWAKTLSPAQMLERIEGHLDLLVSRRRDLPPRHQSLRATFEWSYDLLSPELQACFAWLSVFRGGWDLEAAEQLAAAAPFTPRPEGEERGGRRPKGALALLSELQEQSWIVVEERENETRWRMLEPLREYALEKLAGRCETESVCAWHARYFLDLAEQAEREAQGLQRKACMERLEREHDNLRAVLAWCQADPCRAEMGLRLGASLEWFWLRQGYAAEGRQWLERALARCDQASIEVRAKALTNAGWLAEHQGDRASCAALAGAARSLYEQTLASLRDGEDKSALAARLHRLGGLAFWQGDRAAAEAYYEESLALFREVGDQRSIAMMLYALGGEILARGDRKAAQALFEESLTIWRALGEKQGLIHPLGAVGHIARDEGEFGRAAALYRESLALRVEAQDRFEVAQSLGDFAILAARQGQAERAVRLLGATEARCEALATRLQAAVPVDIAPVVAAAQAALGEEAFTAAWAEGRAMTLEQAIAYAVEDAPTSSGESG
jgi:predicted ATPase/DNA-binding SARP family transcriptional activator